MTLLNCSETLELERKTSAAMFAITVTQTNQSQFRFYCCHETTNFFSSKHRSVHTTPNSQI